MRFQVSSRAYLGNRSCQQDSVGVSVDNFEPQVNIGCDATGTVAHIAVADGMGGHANGEVASSIAAHATLRFLAATYGDAATRLWDGMTLSAACMALPAPPAEEALPMGTTLLSAILDKSGLTWLSVGDSALHLARSGFLLRLNDDHSGRTTSLTLRRAFPQQDIDIQGNMLFSVLQTGEPSQVDIRRTPLPLAEGDILIFATDGLETLRETEILAALTEPSAAAIAEALLERVANKNWPGQDNTSLVVVRVLP